MTTVTTPMDEWNTVPWKQVERTVFKLQKRIYQASARGENQWVRGTDDNSPTVEEPGEGTTFTPGFGDESLWRQSGLV